MKTNARRDFIIIFHRPQNPMAKFIRENSLRPPMPQSEKTVYNQIKNSFGADWTVFHGLRITRSHHRFDYKINAIAPAMSDIEIDFVLFNPKYGLLVLEVKGGIVRHEGGQWYSGSNHIDPFYQALKNKFAVCELFSPESDGVFEPFPIAHAACFPDCDLDEGRLPPEAKGVTISRGQLPSLPAKCVELLELRRPFLRPGAGEISLEEVMEKLSPCCDSENTLAKEIKAEGKIFFELTKMQYGAFQVLKNFKRVNVRGCAGSGKTFIAVNLAREFATAGKNTLLICYNRVLAEKLRRSTKNMPNLRAEAFLDFCIEVCGISPEDIERYRQNPRMWQFALPKMMRERIEKYGISYDAVVVDEGQDFAGEAWKTIEMLVPDGGYFHVFYDPDQNIYQDECQIPPAPDEVLLKVNHRNTKNIFEKIKPMMSIEGATAMDFSPMGSGVREYFIAGEEERRQKLCEILAELNAQKIAGADIVILGGHSLKNTCLKGGSECGGYRIIENASFGPRDVVSYRTYMKFKGCEAPVVILIDVDKNDERWAAKNALYTAMSRAQSLLIVIYSSEG